MDNLVLYRKYRPLDFDEMIGQDNVVGVLKNAVSQNRVAHAYMLSGSRGTGKTSIARILARAVNCEPDDRKASRGVLNRPCNKCKTCRNFHTGKTMDLIEIDAASNRGIDEIRQLREAVRLAPVSSKFRVYIIDEAHMLTKDAFNALLKTLEEPPAHAIFILATTEPGKVPETVSSRTQHLRLRLLSGDNIKKVLISTAKKEGLTIEDSAAEVLSVLSEGSLRDALNLLGQSASVGKDITVGAVSGIFGAPHEKMVEKIGSALYNSSLEEAINVLKEADESGVNPHVFNKVLLHDFRNKFVSAISNNEDGKLSVDQLENALKVLLDTANTKHYSSAGYLPLEIAMARIIRGFNNKE